MSAPDLITQPYLATMMADMGLTANQLAMLSSLTTAASRAVRIHCNRYFTRTIFDELYTLENPTTLVLREFPVNAVVSICANPQTVLTISNTDNVTNQRARFSLATSGSIDVGQTVTGISLTRTASGVISAVSVPFSANITLASVATAINGLGGGWSAVPVPGFEKWASAELRAVQGAMSGFAQNLQGFVIHTDDMVFSLRERSGIVDLTSPSDDVFNSPRWGSFLASDYGDQSLVGQVNGVRAQYDAGYDTIPEDVQQSVVEVVQAMLSRLDTDPSLSGEKDGTYEWTSDKVVLDIPDSARNRLKSWRNVRG